MKTIKSSDIPYQSASHEDPTKPGVFKKVLLQKSDLFEGKIQMINWAKLPAGSSFQAHYHENMQEVFIMLKAGAQAEVGKKKILLAAQDVLVIDPQEVHILTNTTNQDIEYIVVGIAGNKDGKTVIMNFA